MITLKSAKEIESMSRAGDVVARTLQMLRDMVRPGMTTEHLDAEAEKFIRSHKGAKPSFKGLYGFPKTLCVSIDEEIVHGIPSTRRVLAEGSIISIDCGVYLEGLHADSATTVAVGAISPEAQRLMDVTQQSLAAGIVRRWSGTMSATSAMRCSRWPKARGTASCASWWVTASAPVSTRSRRCRTTVRRSVASGWWPG